METPHRHRAVRSLIALATLTAAALSIGTAQSALAASGPVPSTASSGGHQVAVKRLCAAPSDGRMACMALARTDIQAVMADAVVPNATPSGYGPTDLRSAYNLSGTGSAAETIAIVDAYDDPNAESDLAAYRSQYGLSACTTSNGCFRKVNQSGGTSYPGGDSGWAGEISLDVDMVSAIAPSAHILLVEANSASMADLGTAENEAVALGARFVSNSWGGGDSASDAGYDSSYFNHPGVAITVSSGDGAYSAGVEYPAASQYVTAVGGTSLTRASNARGWTESVWKTTTTEGAGSGCSGYDAKPAWQTDSGCAKRMVADVSAVADPATGVAVYDSYGAAGWQVYGGTSAASPIIASVYALAGTPGGGDRPSQYPYQHTSALNDVTTGNNGTCSPAYFCTAEPGYDGPTGLGTPNGATAFASTASSGGNLLQSPSFEGSSAGWQAFVPTGGTVNMVDYNTAAGAPATAHDGTWYLAFNTNAAGGSVYQDVNVTSAANSSWTATAWVAAQSGTASGTFCAWALGPNVNSCHSYTVGTGYTQLQVVLSLPSTYSSIRFQVYPAVNGGTTDLDTTSLVANKLTAGSFEQNTTGWQRFVPTRGTVNMVDYNTSTGAPAPAQDASGYLAFNTNSAGGSVYQDVPVSAAAGTSYTATVWLSSQGGTTSGTFCLWGLGPNTNACTSYSVAAGSYTFYKVVYTVPQALSALRFQVYPTVNGGTTDMDTATVVTS
ncbi:S53 family peptidase [Catenulispora rubra]|uniref:S53 family peptidase n=1 Tax=Catenulispora rubra TaxID=280293 RepID=UPI00226419E6|nr:S53 family peptidase [Catenulispora rubra]